MNVGIKDFIISLFCLISPCLWGSGLDGRYLTNQDGLSNSSVNCIFQDSCGLLWFGTWDGLNMFNSRDIRVFKPDLLSSLPSISNNIIRNVIEERKGVIWVATDYGINRYDINKDEFQNFFCANTRKNVFKERSFFLAKDMKGRIFASVNEYGIYFYETSKHDFVRLDIKISFNVKQMFFDNASRLWLCTEANELYCIKFHHISEEEVLVDSMQQVANINQVEAVFYDAVRDIIWAQTIEKNLFRISSGNKAIRKAEINFHDKITAMIFQNDYCYVGTLKGLYRWDIDSNTTEALLKDISINSLCLGEQHILWVGTDTRGVVLLSEQQNKFMRSSKIPAINFGNAPVRAFWETQDGTLFIGTKGKGLFLFNEEEQSVQNLTITEGLLHNSVYAFTGDDEYVWICTEGTGLNYYSIKEKKLIQVEKTPADLKGEFSICAQSDSVLWIGTNGWGLFKIVLDRGSYPVSVKSYKQYRYQFDCNNCLNNNSIFSVLPDGKEGLWVATRGGGLNYLNFATEQFAHYRHSSAKKETISNDDVLCLYEDTDNSLWVGTSNGLNHLVDRKDSLFQWYTEKEGIPNNTIHGILKDEAGNLWVSTNRGLARLDSKREKIVSYFLTDGLQDDEFSDGASYQSPYSHYFYFGGMNGYSKFNPLEIKEDTYMPSLYLTAFSINNDEVQIEDRLDEKKYLKLNHKENLLTFRFVPIDYIQSSKCEIAYMVEGYSKDWAYLGTSGTIVLNNLPSGEYTLYVKCCNANKEWSQDGYTLNIRVYPPWWLSWYAYLIYTVLLVVCIGFLYRNSIHKIKMKRKLELEMLENQKAEEIHQAKLRFFTNIAHEFCNSLTLIYGPSERLFKLCGDNPVLKRYLSVIKSNAERMQSLIQQLMEFRKVETGYLELYVQDVDMWELVANTTGNFVDIAEEKEITFTIEITPDVRTWNTDRSAFEKVLFNLLSNAFKYTPNKGTVSLNMTLIDGYLHLIIKNTGKGIKEEEQSLVFNRFKVLDRLEDLILSGVETRTGIGLALCKTLVDLMKGSIKIDSKLNEYTAFILQFPMLEKSASRSKVEETAKSPRIELPSEKVLVEKQDVEVNLQNDLNTLLIVDDDDEIRILLLDILQEQYNVLAATDGKDALDLLKKRIPDLVICDIIMPGMNGFELIEQIKAQELTAHIPIILLSSDASVDSKIESAHIGADAYLTKPFHEKHLLATVRQLLSNRKGLKDYFNSPISSIEYVDGKLIHKEDKEFIYNLTKIITANMGNDDFSLETLTLEMGISKMQLYRKLKDIKNETPTDFIRKMRLKQAEHLLKTTNETVLEVMYKCGFNNKAYFYRLFLREYNMTPKEYRESVKK